MLVPVDTLGKQEQSQQKLKINFYTENLRLLNQLHQFLSQHSLLGTRFVPLSLLTKLASPSANRKRRFLKFPAFFRCRSTKSEKLYPSMLHRNTEQETEPYYCLPVGAVLSHWSQPTSPAPGSARTFPLSPTHSTPRHSIPKNDDSKLD